MPDKIWGQPQELDIRQPEPPPAEVTVPDDRPPRGSRQESTPTQLNGLLRPRYFCGQLLTEEDLLAEQRYQMGKNQLHNRYLHGWGVVCGLNVTCHPKCSTGGNINIAKGYAIDCCGNDIIVADETQCNVLDLIKAYEPKPVDECLPTGPKKPDICEGTKKQYCLTIKYKEEEARPVSALIRDDEGCTVKRCEPSRIRETYDLEVSRCPGSCKPDDIWRGTFVGNALECIKKLMDTNILKNIRAINQYTDPDSHDKNLQTFCEFRSIILQLLDKYEPQVHCNAKNAVYEIQFPDKPNTDNDKKVYADDVQKAIRKLFSISVQLLLDCVCLNFQNRCPTCDKNDRVVLARITIEGNRVTEICNQCRRNVISFPALSYWLPVDRIIMDRIRDICCETDVSNNPLQTAQCVTEFITRLRMIGETVKNSMVCPATRLQTADAKFTESVYLQDVKLAKTALEAREIKVVKEIQIDDFIEPSQLMESLPYLLFGSEAIKPGTEVYLYVDRDKRVVYMQSAVKAGVVREDVSRLSKEINDLKTDLRMVKMSMTFMKKDFDATIKVKTGIDNPLVLELAKELTNTMKTEVVTGIGRVTDKALNNAGITSVRGFFEASPASIARAINVPEKKAMVFNENAEAKILKIVEVVSKEIERAKIKKKTELSKFNASILKPVTRLSLSTINDAIKSVRVRR